MSKFIVVHRKTDSCDKEMLVNVDSITIFAIHNMGTYVFLTTGENYLINESLDEIKKMIGISSNQCTDKIIQRSIDLTDSIVAGSYNMPKPMTWALNMLQDSVFDYANENDICIKDKLSYEYKQIKDDYWKEVDNKLKKKMN